MEREAAFVQKHAASPSILDGNARAQSIRFYREYRYEPM